MANKDNKVYDENFIKELSLKRELSALAPLLWNINQEESVAIEKVKNTINKMTINFKSSFLMTSKSQVYKSFSIAGLMKHYNINTKYYVLDLSILLDVWYNSSSLISKDKILNCDVLIIHGRADRFQSEHKTISLIELSGIRKTMRKNTWLFIENATLQEFDELYPGVSSALGKTYRSEF